MKKLIPGLVLVLISLTFMLRVFQLSGIQFDSDFGRDTLFAYRILSDKPTLLGAQASVGGFYLGPLYFYVLAAIQALFGPVPEMVMLFFALLNVGAAWLGWKLLSQKVNPQAGIIFLLLFAASPMLIGASRGATHMPMLPAITVLVLYLLTRAIEKNRWVDHFLAGLGLGLFLHVHFSALLMFPGYFLAVLVLTKGNLAQKTKMVTAGILALLLMASPLIAFDLRHGFITSKAFFGYLMSSASGGSIREAFPHWTLTQKIKALISYLGINDFLALFAGIGLLVGLRRVVRATKVSPVIMPLLFLAASVITLLLLYRGYLFSYYMIVPGTLVLILTAVLLSQIERGFGLILAVVLFVFNLLAIGSIYSPQFRTIPNLTRVTSVIESHQQLTGEKPFNVFKDSADGLTGLAYEYRFLLTRDGFVPISEYSYHDAQVLYVIREDGTSDPLKLGNFEVQQFAPSNSARVGSMEAGGKTIEIFALTR